MPPNPPIIAKNDGDPGMAANADYSSIIPAMFALTREVRFAINGDKDRQPVRRPSNSFAGYPSLLGLGHYLIARVTLRGELQPQTQYLRNIKEIDHVVRTQAIELAGTFVRRQHTGDAAALLLHMFEALRDAFVPATVSQLQLMLSPFLSLTAIATELPMIQLSQKFEFCAAHRLHNPALTDQQNLAMYGKCNNPNWHGHNYLLEVTLAGKPDGNGIIMPVADFEEVVSSTVIDQFDHRNLNTEIGQFAGIVPTVENIAQVIFKMLQPKLNVAERKLASVTVWESQKTWCTYSE